MVHGQAVGGLDVTADDHQHVGPVQGGPHDAGGLLVPVGPEHDADGREIMQEDWFSPDDRGELRKNILPNNMFWGLKYRRSTGLVSTSQEVIWMKCRENLKMSILPLILLVNIICVEIVNNQT